MKIITVSGAHSGVGKTLVAERLLKNLNGWSALKVTVSHNEACPVNRDCGACDSIDSKFSIVADSSRLNKEGKDTARFKKAGARRVAWLRAKPEGLKEGLREAIAKFKGQKGLIIEGTSVLKYIKPDLAILVKRKDSVLKSSAKDIFNKVDLVFTV